MIAWAALWQLTAVSPPAITVRLDQQRTAVPVVATATGAVLRADSLVAILGGAIQHFGDGRHVLVIDTARFVFHDGRPFVQVGRDSVRIARAPFGDLTQLFVPLQFVTGVLPRYLPTLSYDATRAELSTLRRTRYAVGVMPPVKTSLPRTASPGVPPPPHARRATRRWTIVVDAGHGGPDRGMTGPIGGRRWLSEKDVALSIAQRLERALIRRGAVVVMTRRIDTLIALVDRGRLANAAHGDVFVSVHVNAANPRWHRPEDARGFETYFLAEAKTEDARRVESMENEAVRFETGATAAKDDPLGFVITDMAQNEHLRESSSLAELIQQALIRVHPGPSRGVKQAGFRVLVSAYMPAVLVEVGFGTNRREAAFLTDDSGQQAIAEAIAGATLNHLARYARRAGVAER
ncbi:MAG: hypothetical protein NVS4B3_11730 [Gemmatimonadaceae bacterium]